MLFEKVFGSCPVNDRSDCVVTLLCLNSRDFVILNTHLVLLISQLEKSNLVLLS